MKNQVWWSSLLTRRSQYALDLSILIAAFWLAYLLRFDFDIPDWNFAWAWRQLAYVVLIQFAALLLAGVYRFIWRYVSLAEIKAFAKAATWSLLPVLLLRLCLPLEYHRWRVPLSIILVDATLAFVGVLGLRVVRRAVYERYEKHNRVARAGNGRKKPVLLIGAGRAGVMAAREINGRGDTDINIKGFVDDDPKKQFSVIHGVKVLGMTDDLPRLVRDLDIDHVVITITEISRHRMRRIVNICEQIPVKMRIIPGLFEIIQGDVEVSRIRDMQIEDLLGREPIQLDEEGVGRFLAGKTVMVTGAGGSIGSELARQAARFQPSILLLVERAEFALFNIDRELRGLWPGLRIHSLVADIGDESRMTSILNSYRPQLVLHAAAHKHVPMMEDNAAEAVRNNVLATHMLAELAGKASVEAFVLISTDKAVQPTSIMGATKRLAELVVQDLNRQYPTRYVAVRFGNVIGSAGSVIPIFREQIRKGGPVTVTHPDMVRYFMTIQEAAQLVLQAGAMGEGGEIFVLDMGRPVRIFDLAKDTISLSGLKPFDDIEIVFTGVRAGEKLFEELEISEECMSRTRHPKIFIGKIAPRREENLCAVLEELSTLSANGHEPELRAYLSEILPEAQLVDAANAGAPIKLKSQVKAAAAGFSATNPAIH
ncbi:MAG: polysaccharide biosynthesis protein [Pyrinomonadaceae bacterium]